MEVDPDSIEDFDPSLPHWQTMTAGAVAGVIEHSFMFPIDTVKTVLQAQHLTGQTRSFSDTVAHLTRTEGVRRLYRGVSAVALGAAPSHALHFGAYEMMKVKLQEQFGARPNSSFLINSISGGFATMAHDAFVTPLDVVKQNMQLAPMKHKSIFSTVRNLYTSHGMRVFYASYFTTLAMNAPFMGVYFASYERIKMYLSIDPTQNKFVWQHVVAGGCAGALAGCISTPIDVIKTRLQIGSEFSKSSKGFFEVAKSIHLEQGWKGFTNGMSARVLYFIPSAAITWTAYESMKILLKSLNS